MLGFVVGQGECELDLVLIFWLSTLPRAQHGQAHPEVLCEGAWVVTENRVGTEIPGWRQPVEKRPQVGKDSKVQRFLAPQPPDP